MKKLNTLLIILLMAAETMLLNGNIYSQVGQAWVARFLGPNNNFSVSSIALDSTGNIILTGMTLDSTGQHYCTVKYNQTGILQWASFYKGSNQWSIDLARAVGVDANGNVYVTGQSGGGMSNNDYCTVKYNSNGVQQWVARYHFPGTSDNEAYSLAIDNNGNIFVTGFSGSYSASIMYSSSGDSLWTSRYYSLVGWFAAIDNQNNPIITGTSNAGMTTIKYNSSGAQQWVATYPGASYKVKTDILNNVYITGMGDGSKYVTIKYNSTGVQQWKQTYIEPSTGWVKDIAVDKNQNVFITGWVFFNTTRKHDYGIVKYNIGGAQQWANIYNGSANDNDESYSIAVDDSSNIYVTGLSIESSGSKFCTIKYNTMGVQQWLINYPGIAAAVLVDRWRNVYVCGINSDTGILIKYSQFVQINNISFKTPKTYKLEQNYPNPFNPNTKIKFSIPKKTHVQLKIYDVLGRIKELLIDKELSPSVYEVTFNANNYSSGVYFYKMECGEFSDVKKAIVVK
ncbi:MAG: T9SS C-terminal target domain-containing protein [Ignavibacteriae bacterium]|nr:MAG: T9SS C-terminal target domain-containing protein [Ignavibacteriota bacterium]